jgi:hypothetical protein
LLESGVGDFSDNLKYFLIPLTAMQVVPLYLTILACRGSDSTIYTAQCAQQFFDAVNGFEVSNCISRTIVLYPFNASGARRMSQLSEESAATSARNCSTSMLIK